VVLCAGKELRTEFDRPAPACQVGASHAYTIHKLTTLTMTNKSDRQASIIKLIVWRWDKRPKRQLAVSSMRTKQSEGIMIRCSVRFCVRILAITRKI